MNVKKKVYEILKALSCTKNVKDNVGLQYAPVFDRLLTTLLFIELENEPDLRPGKLEISLFNFETAGNVVRSKRYAGVENE